MTAHDDAVLMTGLNLANLSPAAAELLLTVVSQRQSRPSSPARMFTVTGYRHAEDTAVTIRPGWGGASIAAARACVAELVTLGYLEWIVPPVMIFCLDVTAAGIRYAERLIGAVTMVHPPDLSHWLFDHEVSSTAG